MPAAVSAAVEALEDEAVDVMMAAVRGGSADDDERSVREAECPQDKIQLEPVKGALPEDLAESLAALALGAGCMGVDKLINQFKQAHEDSNLTKRQVKEWIGVHLVRDRPNPEAQLRWRRRTEAEVDDAKAAAEAVKAAKGKEGATAEGETKGNGKKPGGGPVALSGGQTLTSSGVAAAEDGISPISEAHAATARTKQAVQEELEAWRTTAFLAEARIRELEAELSILEDKTPNGAH